LEDSGFGLYETLDMKLSGLLHKEYPTKKRYRQKLLEEDATGRRGHFPNISFKFTTVNNR